VKTSSIILLGLLLGVSVENASAGMITVNVHAHVVSWVDSTGVFGGQVNVGQPVTATYTYDTSTPVLTTGNGYDQYLVTSPPATLSVSTGAFTFQSAAGIHLQLTVQPSTVSGQPSNFVLNSQVGQPLASGTPVGLIQFDFEDFSGHWPTSVALPTVAPAVQNLSSSRILVQVGTSSSQLVAQVDSVALAPPVIEVSPATGSFLPQQHFDFALLLPAGTNIVSAQATAHGFPMSLYPGLCQLAPANSADRPAILCPSGDLLLANLGPGPQQINWQVVLSDGTTVNQSVVWTLIQ
jgi:hypothetical protein